MTTKNDHDTLWAPWRMAYIDCDSADGGAKQPAACPIQVGPEADADCFLCQAVFDAKQDRHRGVLRRTEQTISVLNRFPYNNGHLLVAPCRHVGRLNVLTEAEQGELLREIDRWVQMLEKTMNPDGFNIGINIGHAAGAGLPGHLHWHIVPRWSGDVNFMTSIASARVIPQSLEALWELLVSWE